MQTNCSPNARQKEKTKEKKMQNIFQLKRREKKPFHDVAFLNYMYTCAITGPLLSYITYIPAPSFRSGCYESKKKTPKQNTKYKIQNLFPKKNNLRRPDPLHPAMHNASFQFLSLNPFSLVPILWLSVRHPIPRPFPSILSRRVVSRVQQSMHTARCKTGTSRRWCCMCHLPWDKLW